MTKLVYKYEYILEDGNYSYDNPDFYSLGYALDHNEVYSSAQIKTQLACLVGENDELNWHWLVELENGKIAYLRGWCDYTGFDCQSSVQNVNEYDSLEQALSNLGLPALDVNSDRLIREEFRTILEKDNASKD